MNRSQVECSVGGWPCVLACSVVWPCLRAEQLLVCVGAHGGRLRARVPAYPASPRMPDLARALAATDLAQIKALLTQLRLVEIQTFIKLSKHVQYSTSASFFLMSCLTCFPYKFVWLTLICMLERFQVSVFSAH